MGRLGPLILLLSCADAPSGPAAGPDRPGDQAELVVPPPSDHPRGPGILDPGQVAWSWPTATPPWLSDPDLLELGRRLTIVRREDPGVPERLWDGRTQYYPMGSPDWIPRWGQVPADDGLPGHVLLWWNQDRPTWDVWEIWEAEGRAERRYQGGVEGRPEWLAAVAPEHWDHMRAPPPEDVPAVDDALWWRRATAARWLPKGAWTDALTLAGDPHPEVRSLAQDWLLEAWRAGPDGPDGPPPQGGMAHAVRNLASSPSPQARASAIWLAAVARDPGSQAATLPLLCDEDPLVAESAISSLAGWLPDSALEPWWVHPRKRTRQVAVQTWERRRTEPDIPDVAPSFPQAISAAWAAAPCAPRFTGRYDLALWGTSLATEAVQVVLRGKDGQVVGRGSAAARPSWTVGLVMAVTAPPETAEVVQGQTRTRFSVPPTQGAALSLGCARPAPPPALDQDPARVWQATSSWRLTQGCTSTVLPALLRALEAVPEAEQAAALQRIGRSTELDLIAVARQSGLASIAFRKAQAHAAAVTHRRDDCIPWARDLLDAGLYDDTLDLDLRVCRFRQPEVYPLVLEAVEAGRIPLQALQPLPQNLSKPLRARVVAVAEPALPAAPPDQRALPFRLLDHALPQGDRHAGQGGTVLFLPGGGAALSLTEPCLGPGDGGATQVEGVLVLHGAPTPTGEGTVVRLLEPEPARALHTVACGARQLWRRDRR